MSFLYRQSTGEMTDGVFIAIGYSGNGPGLNNPAMEQVRCVGPLPQGTYTIQPAVVDEVLGPVAMRLEPTESNAMYGRADFFIHGDNAAMNHTASEGCIVLALPVRVSIAQAVLLGNKELEVTA